MEQILKHTKWDTFIKNITINSWWVAMDLTWAEIVFSIKEKYSDTEYVLTQTAEIIDATAWKCKIEFTSTQMDLMLKSYYYDIQITDSTWKVDTPLKWNLIITYNVTNNW
jgi:hypothetical protein